MLNNWGFQQKKYYVLKISLYLQKQFNKDNFIY